MPLLALGHPDGNGIGGYGISHPDRLATIDGLYFLDHPRRAPRDYLDALGSMFGEFLIVENNRTQERGLVARMEVPAGSRQYLRPHQAAGGWPTEPKLAGILGDGPEVVLRVQWVPGNEAWGVAKHGRTSGTMVDRVALGAALSRYPEAGKFLRDFFWTAAPRDCEENRRLYGERLGALARTDRYMRDNRGGLLAAFEEVLNPLGEPPR
ncbi:MAG: hypothetical protein L6R43_00630 [Planctomycetes bacterium]|nr:hypothetical protein [Planctomycetota bacterium]